MSSEKIVVQVATVRISEQFMILCFKGQGRTVYNTPYLTRLLIMGGLEKVSYSGKLGLMMSFFISLSL